MRAAIITVLTLALSATRADAEPQRFAPGEIVAKFGTAVPRTSIDAALERCALRVRLDSTTLLDAAAHSPRRTGSLPAGIARLARNVFWLEVRSPGQSVPRALACLRRERSLVFAERNLLSEPDAHRADHYPNDPAFAAGSQWGLLNAGQPDPAGNPGTIDADIDAVQAWDLPHTDCRRVIVAVFDTGADLVHPDLAPNLWTNPNALLPLPVGGLRGFDAVFFDGDPTDDLLPGAAFAGHGTAVAGIIGAAGNNALDMTGICWQAQIMTLRIGAPLFGVAPTFWATLYVLIQKFVFGQDVRIVNLSGSWPGPPGALLALTTTLLTSADILFVVTAGNTGPLNPARFPCNFPDPKIVCVASSTNRDTLAGTSSTTGAHLAAPGRRIITLRRGADGGGTTPPPGKSGTSFAAPHVTGVAALALSLFPGKGAVEVKDDILVGAAGGAAAPPASGTDRVKAPPLVPVISSIFERVSSRGRLRWPYTGDLGDAPPGYDTIAAAGGALHWDIGNEFFGDDSTPEVDAITPPPLDQDPIINLVDTDFADHPIAPGNGNFAFFPPPPWAAGAVVLVTYDLCSDYFGILDADGGRYQGGSLDRTLFANAWFDLDHNGMFTNDELLLEDLISPAPPAPPAKPLYPNVTINLHPVLPVPAAAPVFPPATSCVKIASLFTVPPPGGTPDWIRFRVDFGEDIGVNSPPAAAIPGPLPLFAADQLFPVLGHRYRARHGEVEDFRPPEVDYFPASEGIFTLQVPFGQQSVTLTGPTTIYVGIGLGGEATDTDGDGLDQVLTEIVQLELEGVSSLGPVKVRLRKDTGPGGGTPPSLGEIEELVNTDPGRLDIPPFALTGTAESFFDVFFEVEIGTLKLHNKDPKRMRGRITQKPPRRGELYESPTSIVLYDEQDQPTGFVLTFARHVPDPERQDEPPPPR